MEQFGTLLAGKVCPQMVWSLLKCSIVCSKGECHYKLWITLYWIASGQVRHCKSTGNEPPVRWWDYIQSLQVYWFDTYNAYTISYNCIVSTFVRCDLRCAKCFRDLCHSLPRVVFNSSTINNLRQRVSNNIKILSWEKNWRTNCRTVAWKTIHVCYISTSAISFFSWDYKILQVISNEKYTRCRSLLMRSASEALTELCSRASEERRGNMAAKVWETGMSFIIMGQHSSAFGTLFHFFIFILHLRGEKTFLLRCNNVM